MTRRGFVSTLGAAAAQAPRRPNLLLLMTDQQSFGAWSGAGNPWLRTPAMDSIAKAGTSFGEAYCAYPVCSPSRGSIFTSRLPHETGVRVNGKAIAPGMATMGEMFRSAGYRTVYGGKWHLPKSFDGMTGFEKIAGGDRLGAHMDEPLAGACSEWLRTKGRGGEPFLMVASFMNPHDICEWIRQHPGHRSHPGLASFPPVPGNMAVSAAEPEFMRYHRTAGYDQMSKGVGIASEWRRDDVRHYLHGYYRLIEDVDRQIGRVLGALRETGLDRDTLIAFCSDHGEGMGAHRWVQKAAFYEESAHVPLLFAGPGVRSGQVDRASLASLADILPTFCDYAGVKPPADARGVSLRPVLEGGKALDRPWVAGELRYGDASREGRMIRSERFKYVAFNGGADSEQLFDLWLDPGETFNLAPLGGQDLVAHREILARQVSRTGDDFKRA